MSTTNNTTTQAGSVERPVGQCCEHCDDGDGFSVFPYYGPAPHTHDTSKGWIGSTRFLPRDQWGDNFREDPDCEGYGIYMRCPHCDRGEQPNTEAEQPARAKDTR
jgi:hypothetical protein